MNPFRNHTFLSATLFVGVMLGNVSLALGLAGCGSSRTSGGGTTIVEDELPEILFSPDSAYSYVKRQVEFGPRKPGTASHARTASWIQSELKRHGAKVTLRETELRTFDGVTIPVYNILGSINPDADKRVLLVAHWDCRPWADEDPDPAKRHLPVDGANDAASGVGVLLELARVLPASLPSGLGVDLLMVDAEDWGTSGNDDSWAMGTRHFIANPPEEWKLPEIGIVVDMVGDRDATFYREYFSEQSSPATNNRLWGAAEDLGYTNHFRSGPGSAVTDDHVELIKGGIPAVDIIDFRPDGEQSGFCPQWHTSGDTLDRISAETLGAVGQTIELYLKRY